MIQPHHTPSHQETPCDDQGFARHLGSVVVPALTDPIPRKDPPPQHLVTTRTVSPVPSSPNDPAVSSADQGHTRPEPSPKNNESLESTPGSIPPKSSTKEEEGVDTAQDPPSTPQEPETRQPSSASWGVSHPRASIEEEEEAVGKEALDLTAISPSPEGDQQDVGLIHPKEPLAMDTESSPEDSSPKVPIVDKYGDETVDSPSVLFTESASSEEDTGLPIRENALAAATATATDPDDGNAIAARETADSASETLPLVPEQATATRRSRRCKTLPEKQAAPATTIAADAASERSFGQIMCGRGCGSYSRSPGNIRFRRLIQSFRDLYDSAHTTAKRRISALILDYVLEHGGTFVQFSTKKDGSSKLEDLAYKKCAAKISQTFRDFRGVGKISSDVASSAMDEAGFPDPEELDRLRIRIANEIDGEEDSPKAPAVALRRRCSVLPRKKPKARGRRASLRLLAQQGRDTRASDEDTAGATAAWGAGRKRTPPPRRVSLDLQGGDACGGTTSDGSSKVLKTPRAATKPSATVLRKRGARITGAKKARRGPVSKAKKATKTRTYTKAVKGGRRPKRVTPPPVTPNSVVLKGPPTPRRISLEPPQAFEGSLSLPIDPFHHDEPFRVPASILTPPRPFRPPHSYLAGSQAYSVSPLDPISPIHSTTLPSSSVDPLRFLVDGTKGCHGWRKELLTEGGFHSRNNEATFDEHSIAWHEGPPRRPSVFWEVVASDAPAADDQQIHGIFDDFYEW